jgi:hypothetical protein
LRRGVTEADLKRVGKWPRLNDELARWAMISENTVGHDLRSEDGRKSSEEDFKGEVSRILKTSEGVTGGRVYKVELASGGLGVQRMVKDD